MLATTSREIIDWPSGWVEMERHLSTHHDLSELLVIQMDSDELRRAHLICHASGTFRAGYNHSHP